MSKPKQPKQPNVANVAKQQFKLAKNAAQWSQGLNAVNQSVPGGQLKFKKNNKGQVKGIKVKLDEPSQEYYDSTMGAKNQFLDQLPQEAFDPSSVDMSRAGEVEKAYYDKNLAMVQPELDRAASLKRLELEERGLPVGSEIYVDENERLDKSRSDTLNEISRNATLAGGAEQDRLLAAALTKRNQPFNEYASVVSGAQMQQPQFQQQQGYSVPASDITTPTYSMYNQQAQQAQNSNNSIWNGLWSLGAGAIGLSDERFKEDIRRVGKTDDGLGVFTFRYKGDPTRETRMGVLAQEAEKVAPAAVFTANDGVKYVDYARIS